MRQHNLLVEIDDAHKSRDLQSPGSCRWGIHYKNSRDWDLPDNEEQRRLGALWEARSNGKGLFIMPKGQDGDAILRKININKH